MHCNKYGWLFIAVFFTATFLSACSSSDGEMTDVRVGEVTRSIFYAPQYVAISQGFFEEEGLNIDLTTTWGGDTTMTSLLSDGIDIALVGAETSIYVYAQDANDPAVNFAQLTQTDGTFLVSREPVGQFDWNDLKGSTFLAQRAGGMPQMVGEYVLKQNGIDPQKDLELIQNIDFGNIPSAFASGTGDYVQLFEPTATQFEEEGLGFIIDSFGTQSGNLPYTVYMSKASYLKNNEETVEKFTRALYQAQQWVQEQAPEVIAEAIQDFFEDTPLSTIEQVVERYRDQGSFAENPLLQEDGWYLLQEVMAEAGELPMEVPYNELVNTEIVTGVIEE
ncbi:NitT/TauT family transport system substrate-binding protein [Evansella caseinilytica]|uniref:NitT/TauT family transport system substrate-binding protein n=1 Tax=Evansella caseinilytica TaxID=1503961 RepID=A0A1H3RX89_9BACI|nr:ABC transporter substrate-binding protein [Evansella caseinilytica]SDZ29938.1 NitT/TauT family transport system substrate-binding protein [Evansella caseinilytica]